MTKRSGCMQTSVRSSTSRTAPVRPSHPDNQWRVLALAWAAQLGPGTRNEMSSNTTIMRVVVACRAPGMPTEPRRHISSTQVHSLRACPSSQHDARADLFALLKTLQSVESAFSRGRLDAEAYERCCTSLLTQWNNAYDSTLKEKVRAPLLSSTAGMRAPAGTRTNAHWQRHAQCTSQRYHALSELLAAHALAYAPSAQRRGRAAVWL